MSTNKKSSSNSNSKNNNSSSKKTTNKTQYKPKTVTTDSKKVVSTMENPIFSDVTENSEKQDIREQIVETVVENNPVPEEVPEVPSTTDIPEVAPPPPVAILTKEPEGVVTLSPVTMFKRLMATRLELLRNMLNNRDKLRNNMGEMVMLIYETDDFEVMRLFLTYLINYPSQNGGCGNYFDNMRLSYLVKRNVNAIYQLFTKLATHKRQNIKSRIEFDLNIMQHITSPDVVTFLNQNK